MFQKGVYPYEYMADWKKFNKTLLSEKYFCNNVNIEYINVA